jgi:hypothetical protein
MTAHHSVESLTLFQASFAGKPSTRESASGAGDTGNQHQEPSARGNSIRGWRHGETASGAGGTNSTATAESIQDRSFWGAPSTAGFVSVVENVAPTLTGLQCHSPCLSDHPSMGPSAYLSVCPFVCLCGCLSVGSPPGPETKTSVCLSVYRPTHAA